MRVIHIVSLVILFGFSSAFAQNAEISLNMTLFDHLNPVDTAGSHSALWGYTAPDGREYALFGSQIGTHIIDITETPIRQVAFIGGPRTPWREMKVYKHYAYVVNDSKGEGLQIIDLSKLPASATLVRSDSSFFRTAHTVFIRDHYLYAMGTPAETGVNRGALILDLEPDPLHPVRVGGVTPYYYHDAFVRNDTLLGAAIAGEGCDIYDIHDKTSPKHLATIHYPFSGTHNAELTPDGGYVATTDEVGFTPKTLKVWDIHDLENISLAAEFTPSPEDIVHNVHFLGRYAIVAWYTAGVRIIDMIDPRHPREVGYYDTYPGKSGSYDGVWEAFGAFPSGKIIAGDRQTGLYVLRFNNAIAGSVSGTVRNAATGDPLPNVRVTIRGGVSVTSDAAGKYYLGGPDGSAVTLVTDQFGYGGTSELVTMAGEAKHDILLSPLQFFSASIAARDDNGNPIVGFAFAVEPYIHSTAVADSTGALSLPRDSTFTIVVGKWGYKNERVQRSLNASGERIVVTLHRRYFDDATLDLGWSYQAPDDSATTGLWTRIVPYLGYPRSDWVHPPSEPFGGPGHIFITGAPPLNAPPQTGDVNHGQTTLTSPMMDLRNYQDPRINYHLWFVHYEQDTVRDTMKVEISNDGGMSWVTAAWFVKGRAGWRYDTLYPKQLLPLTDRMKIRFRASDRLGSALVLAAMDNFEVVQGNEASDAPLATKESAASLSLRVVPNPVRGSAAVTLDLPDAESWVRVELFDPLARRLAVLHEGSLGSGVHRFDLPEGIPSGPYLLSIIDAKGTRSSVRFQVIR